MIWTNIEPAHWWLHMSSLFHPCTYTQPTLSRQYWRAKLLLYGRLISNVAYVRTFNSLIMICGVHKVAKYSQRGFVNGGNNDLCLTPVHCKQDLFRSALPHTINMVLTIYIYIFIYLRKYKEHSPLSILRELKSLPTEDKVLWNLSITTT